MNRMNQSGIEYFVLFFRFLTVQSTREEKVQVVTFPSQKQDDECDVNDQHLFMCSSDSQVNPTARLA